LIVDVKKRGKTGKDTNAAAPRCLFSLRLQWYTAQLSGDQKEDHSLWIFKRRFMGIFFYTAEGL
jgi:hypothetical protein